MLLVFGPRSTDYDFGPGHPLTPRRFGPGIDLLRSVGAEPGLAPEPATDADLLLCHDAGYLEVVRRFSVDPYGLPEAGIGLGDNPPFPGMHDAGAAVAGGSLRAMEAILRGDVEHAFHPGGGLHHAMRDRAAGFCIYNDPALAIARARRDGLRVMYIDLDVHHGDGVQALFWDDPGVLTFSIHESGRYLFPGTGDASELGQGVAAGTSVNVPLLPDVGERPWLMNLESLLPELAAAFGPDLDRVAARRRLARLGSAGAPERDDDGARARRLGWSIGSRIATRAVGGWPRAVAATTPTGWCRGPGR